MDKVKCPLHPCIQSLTATHSLEEQLLLTCSSTFLINTTHTHMDRYVHTPGQAETVHNDPESWLSTLGKDLHHQSF